VKDSIILDDDKMYAKKRIAELDAQIQALGPEFYDVFNQSSETWHDNAPFDALRDRQSVLDAERQYLRRMLRESLPGVPTAKEGVIGIGSEIELSDGARYFIAGDWTPYAGHERNGIMTISRRTPLATALLGKKVNDAVTIGRNEVTVTVVRNKL